MSDGPLPRFLAPLTHLIEPMYRCTVARRNARFDQGDGVTQFDVPVVAVGNISVGGSGKTPMCRKLLGMLLERERRPALVLRGYRATPGSPSDEEAEYRDAFPGISIVANPDRCAAIRTLLASESPPDCIVLDDAFQHRRVHRDLDIVLVDATRDTLADRCLPAGWLREPVASLARADFVVLTRADQVAERTCVEQSRRLRELTDAPVAEAMHTWSRLQVDDEQQPTERLHRQPVMIATAIGNPEAFIDQAQQHGAEVVSTLLRRDHHAWSAADLAEIRSRLNTLSLDTWILTTEKDWVKWRRLDLAPVSAPFVRPCIDFTLCSGGNHLAELLDAAMVGSAH